MPVIEPEPVKREPGYEMISVELEVKDTKEKDPPIVQAAKKGQLEVLKKCLNNGDNFVDVEDGDETILHLAANNDDFTKAIECCEEIIFRLQGNPELLHEFINRVDILNQTAATYAAFKGNHRLLRILLNYGIKLTSDFRNETLFHCVAKLENHENALSCAEILLDLQYYQNDEEKLKEYLNTEKKNTLYTALHEAGFSGNHQLIKLLVHNGSNATKVDLIGRNVLHHVVNMPIETSALNCTAVLMGDDLYEDWKETKKQLLHTFDKGGKCPIHICTRRGFHEVLKLLLQSYLISEGNTGCTPLHLAASIGNPTQAEQCVKVLLDHISDSSGRKEYLNAKDSEGCTALYLSAQHKNLNACQLLLSAESGFDIKTKRGKTPLDKVYEKIPQAVSILLKEAKETSGYVAYRGTINTFVEIDYGPILGFNTEKENMGTVKNIYKETENLAKVCNAKFEDRKELLYHTFVRVYIHKKWEIVKWFFLFFRLLHIIWFLFNFYFVISIYRVNCPYADAKEFSWTGLRPNEDGNHTETKSLAECEMTQGTRILGLCNLAALFIYVLSQVHQTKARFHRFWRSRKESGSNKNWIERIFKWIGHYLKITYKIFPCWPFVITIGILLSTLPVLGSRPMSETSHYFVASILGFFSWIAVFLEVGKVPRFRVYVNLLTKSTTTLLWAIAVTVPILFGFATIFVILMPGESSFTSAAQSFIKIITFMIGELDYQGLFYGDEKGNAFTGFVMVALGVFVVVIVVLLVNFLIGLAAEEIRDFSERKEIWKLCTQIEQIVMLESFLDERLTFIGREYISKYLMLMPPEKLANGKLRQWRKALIKIPDLPQKLQKEIHEMGLKTLRIEKY